ncbi:hypothetical protein [Dactylosporangium sp. CA-233914]|uniref:hypothetical protein n=1 Tax=Dactylosporangium sp. CA-233914 TaxID=3239934 RepID=UPI003D8B5850
MHIALDDLPGHSGSTVERLPDGSLAEVDADLSRGEGDRSGRRPSPVGVFARCSCGWTSPTEHRPDEVGRMSAISDWIAHMRPLWAAAPPGWLLNRSDSLRESVTELAGTWPLQALGVLAHLESWQRTATEEAVARARDAGSSWADIGAVLGITRQSAHERFTPARATGNGSRGRRRPVQP